MFFSLNIADYDLLEYASIVLATRKVRLQNYYSCKLYFTPGNLAHLNGHDTLFP